MMDGLEKAFITMIVGVFMLGFVVALACVWIWRILDRLIDIQIIF